MKRAFALPLVFVLMLLMVVPVSAGPPVVVTTEHDIDYAAFDKTLCPDISIHNHEIYTERLTFYYDNEGNLKRIRGHVDGVDNLYNFDNPGVVLSGHFTVNFELHPQTFELLSATGVPYHITAPGYGTVLVRAGRWEVTYPDGHVAGKDSLIDPKDVEQFCSIMAGD
jgi:hypothetical protein